MVKLILICFMVLSVVGCVSPYQKQADDLNRAYRNGQLTYPEYVQAYQNLQILDWQYRQNMSAAFQNAGNSLGQTYGQTHSITVIPMGGNSYQTQCHADSFGNINCTTQYWRKD